MLSARLASCCAMTRYSGLTRSPSARCARDSASARDDEHSRCRRWMRASCTRPFLVGRRRGRSEEHTSELQSRLHLVCRLLLEKKKHKHSTRSDSENESPQSHICCTCPAPQQAGHHGSPVARYHDNENRLTCHSNQSVPSRRSN